MNRTLKDQLREWKQEYQEVARMPHKRRREVLSDSDIRSLMGVYRPTYRKHRGSFRQK